ncbi:DUF1592 domain-containing protein [bacterium]|nr:DUF1592 domain-containing protein [Verrucomicrobiota bacterium]MDA7669465.1 DUF1592 domain-containing protein [bacterium]
MGDVVRKQTRPTCQTYVWLWALVSMLSWVQTGWGQSDAFSDDEGTAFIDQYCVDCHQPPKPKGKLDLTPYTTVDQIVTDALDWDSHLNRVRDEDMPPDDDDVTQPTMKERMAFVDWMQQTLSNAACSDGIQPGPPMVRRLNQGEYSASVRALLDIHFDAGEALPNEGAGGEGFDNAAETLFISPIHAEKYLDAARSAVKYAFADTRSSQRFLIAVPDENTTPPEAARKILEKFLPRAFRRQASPNEVSEYLDLFEQAYAEEKAFGPAMQLTLSAVLISPKFLFIIESPTESAEPIPLDGFELATRLSYFLWGAPPDDTLMQVAADGTLQEPEILKGQVIRMLKDPHARKVRNFAQTFVEQWLGTRALGREFKPDKSIKGYDSELEGGMKYEPVFFFHEILTENRPLLDLIDADYTYINRRLSRHYKVKGEFREQPKRVDIENDPHRGGLLSMAAILAVSSHPHRTSPVLRGKWILETLLGDTPPPPPPGTPLLDEDSHEEEAQSLRQRLEQHRADPTCATCHDKMDPLGFSLENYDVLGRWRTEEGGQPVDAKATMPDGTEFEGPAQLKQILMDRKDQIVRHLTRKMLGYALSRGLTFEDFCTIDAIVEDLKSNEYASHRLLMGIVESIPFRYKFSGKPTESE